MSNEKDKFIGEELLSAVDSVVIDDSPRSKLSGVDDELDQLDDEPVTKSAGKKKKSNIPLYAAAAVVTVVAFVGLAIKMDMNSKQSQLVDNDVFAEETLFGSTGQQADGGAFAADSYALDAGASAAQQEQEFPSYDWTASTQTGTLQQSSSMPEQLSSAAVTKVAQQGVDVVDKQTFEALALRVDGLFAMLSDASAKQVEISQQVSSIAEKLNPSSSGSSESDPVTKKEFINALRSLRALQAQSEKVSQSIKSIEQQIGVDVSGASKPSKDNQSGADVALKPQAQGRAGNVASLTPNAGSVVANQEQGQRQTRELAWSSYIENFGVATIEGTTDMIELRPGDLVVSRGLISKISAFGCIEFTNGTKYAPTNGVCN